MAFSPSDNPQRRLQASPDDPYVHMNAAWRFLNACHYDRAIACFESDLDDRGRAPQPLSNLAIARYRSGRQEQAQELLTELETMAAERFVSPALLASVYFAAGEADRGFASLQDAVDAKVRDVIFIRGWTVLDEWRDDPRYLALLQTIGFSPAD